MVGTRKDHIKWGKPEPERQTSYAFLKQPGARERHTQDSPGPHSSACLKHPHAHPVLQGAIMMSKNLVVKWEREADSSCVVVRGSSEELWGMGWYWQPVTRPPPRPGDIMAISGFGTAGVCVDIHDLYCYQCHRDAYPGCGLPPVAIFVSKGHAATWAMLIWMTYTTGEHNDIQT